MHRMSARAAQAGPDGFRWLAACLERGAATACFVATPEFRIIWLHTRYRRDLTDETGPGKQRAEKLLESAAISRRPWSPTCTGHRPGHHQPPHRRGTQPEGAGPAGPRTGPPQDQPAGRGPGGAEFFTEDHAAPFKTMLERIDRINAENDELIAVIERLLAPYEEQLQQVGMPGRGRRSGRDAIAERPVPT